MSCELTSNNKWKPQDIYERKGAANVQRLNGETSYVIDEIQKESSQAWIEVKFGRELLGVFPPSDPCPSPTTITLNIDFEGKLVFMNLGRRE
ncbi:MAG TPA: hypothetical protein VF185_01290 [Patescibacteria group bacterium]